MNANTKNYKSYMESLPGRILVASSQLDGSIFEKALVFVCAHDEEGAVGVMFNRPISQIFLNDLVKKLNIKKKFAIHRKHTIFLGGPFDQKRMVILSANKHQQKLFKQHAQLTLYNDSTEFFKDVVAGVNKDKFIICRGFCSWAPGQLEQEVRENSWLVVEASLNIIFSKQPQKEWTKIVKKLGINDFDKLVSYTGMA